MASSPGAASDVAPMARPRQRRGWLVLSFSLVAAGLFLIVWGLHGPQVGPSIPGPIGVTSLSNVSHAAPPVSRATGTPVPRGTPVASPTPPRKSTTAPTTVPSTAAATAVASSSKALSTSIDPLRPIQLSIPVIGLSDDVSELGLNANGTVQVPTSWQVPGWYKYGPSPGEQGSAVILGHVDSVNGPAAFYRLSALRPGDKVMVRLAGGTTEHFKVIGLRLYAKKNFPDRLVYGPRPYSALQLVTCGGAFDSTTHHYVSNLVVFTALIS